MRVKPHDALKLVKDSYKGAIQLADAKSLVSCSVGECGRGLNAETKQSFHPWRCYTWNTGIDLMKGGAERDARMRRLCTVYHL
jgi:hypothetical protein